MLKHLIILSFLLTTGLSLFGIGYLLGGQLPGLICVSIFSLIIFGSYTITDKAFLALTNSYIMLQKSPFIERVKNISFYMDLKLINVFITKELPQNIYILDSLFGRPSVIITEELIDTLNDKQLDFLIKKSLTNIQSGDALSGIAMSALFVFIQIPLFILGKYPFCNIFVIVFNFFLAPFKVFKECLIKNIYQKLECKEDVYQMNEILSRIGLSRNSNWHVSTFIMLLAKDIAIIPPPQDKLWDYLIYYYHENKSQALLNQKNFLS